MTRNFLGLDPSLCNYEDARFAVLPIPYEATVTFQSGTARGPEAIIRASAQVELFDEELLFDPSQAGVATLGPVLADLGGPEQMQEAIFTAARRPVRDGKFLLGLGGEHSVTAGLVRAIAPAHEKLSILQIDAHLDLRNEYEGSPWSHACVMRRCLDHANTIVPVGIRNVSEEEHGFLGKSGIQPIFARECLGSDDWIDTVLESLGDDVYVTIDIDGFDPAFAPGTGTPEPGGLDWYQVADLLRLVCAEKHVVGADVVEVMPIPGQAVTEFLAARLAYKLIGFIAARESGRL